MPFSQLDVSTPKPIGHGYSKEPQTIGNHLRNKRLLLKLEQKDVAKLMNVNCKTYAVWEVMEVFPKWKYFPKIIQFLGYNPVKTEGMSTVSGKIRMCCVLNGLNKSQLSRKLGIDMRNFKHWEDGKSEPKKEVKDTLERMLSEQKP